jgi:DNA-binding LacI/PurR family transcriptional regulator
VATFESAAFGGGGVIDTGLITHAGVAQPALSVPEEVSLAGVHDMPWSTALSPPLTAVSQPIEALAREACVPLLQRIAGLTPVATPSRRTLFAPTLVVRDSCARPSAGASSPDTASLTRP